MKKIICLMVMTILISGCATKALHNRGANALLANGLVQAYPGSDAYLTPSAARISNEPAVLSASLGAQPLTAGERQSLFMSASQRSQSASEYSAHEWPFQTLAARIWDYIILPIGGATAAGGVIYGIDQLALGGGDGDKEAVEVNGDGNVVTYYGNDGDVNDSHDETTGIPVN